MSGDGVSGHGVSGHGVSGHGVSGHGVSGHGVSGHGVSGHGASGHGASGHGASGHGASGRCRACDRCLARAWLLACLGGHLDRARGRLEELLALPDDQLAEAVGGRRDDDLRQRRAGFHPDAQRARIATAGLEAICGCDPAFPAGLRELDAPPRALYVAGGLDRFLELLAQEPVAVVGARRASPYGLGVARSLAAGLTSAGLTVVSGMALGIDSAALQGAVDADAATLAVLPGGADRPYPVARRALYRRIAKRGAIVSELGPGVAPRRWMFPARNRIIAGLSTMTVVVQARAGSGALLTAEFARRLGPVGAVPGPVTSPLSEGPHELIGQGAALVAGPQDVLDAVFGVGVRSLPALHRRALEPPLAALLDAICEGQTADVAFARAGLSADGGLAALASLELAGLVRREPGGGFTASG